MRVGVVAAACILAVLRCESERLRTGMQIDPFTTAERKVFGSQFLGSVGALFASTEQSADLPEAVIPPKRRKATKASKAA